ncbi:MAG: hypothetical protein WCX17_02270 [Parcubacteria group bacterium]|jgi:N-acetylglutamate synthase-like GNAT family acetyltransferase/isopentenyl phosphate kinase
MEIVRTVKEILDYVRQFRGKIIVVKVNKDVLADKKKLNNVIRDMILLKSAGIKIVATHSEARFTRDQWLSLEPVFLGISTISGITGQMAKGATPVVYFEETPKLSSEKAIVSLAIKLGAVKIVYVTNFDGIFESGKRLIHEMDVEQARELLKKSGAVTGEARKRVEVALIACGQGIPRIHIIGAREGSLLKEILTCHGTGTMIYKSMYQEIEPAKKSEVAEIFGIIKEAIKQTSITFERIKKKIDNFWVFVVDEQVHGCMLIENDTVSKICEISYLSASEMYKDSQVFKRLILSALEKVPTDFKCVFLSVEKNTNLLGIYPWFKELGFAKRLPAQCGIAGENHFEAWIRITE